MWKIYIVTDEVLSFLQTDLVTLVGQNASLVGQRALDGLRDGGSDGSHGQMGTDGLETVLVSDVVDAVLLAIISDVLVESVGAEGGVLGSNVVDLARLLSQDLVLSLVQVVVSIDLVVLDVTDDGPATLSLAVHGLGLNVDGLGNDESSGLRNLHSGESGSASSVSTLSSSTVAGQKEMRRISCCTSLKRLKITYTCL